MVPILDRRSVGVRIVALNRPGYGASTYQPNRRIVDWPRDVAEVADQLRIGRFAVLGVSGGGPYALACGGFLGERLTHVGVVAGVAPLAATGMEGATAISGPSSVGFVRKLQFGLAAYAFRRGHAAQFIDRSIATMGGADREAMSRPEVRSWFNTVMEEAFSEGSRGVAHEANLYRRSWGFEPSQIEVHTRLWYGGVDETVPASAGQWLHDRLPDSTYVTWPQHGHFTWMYSDQAVEVVASLLGQAPP